MTTPDCILALFDAVDHERLEVPQHPDAQLSPSAGVTLALLHAMQGGGTRAFSRWRGPAMLCRGFRRGRSAPVWPGSSRPTRHGPPACWPHPRCLASRTPTGVR